MSEPFKIFKATLVNKEKTEDGVIKSPSYETNTTYILKKYGRELINYDTNSYSAVKNKFEFIFGGKYTGVESVKIMISEDYSSIERFYRFENSFLYINDFYNDIYDVYSCEEDQNINIGNFIVLEREPKIAYLITDVNGDIIKITKDQNPSVEFNTNAGKFVEEIKKEKNEKSKGKIEKILGAKFDKEGKLIEPEKPSMLSRLKFFGEKGGNRSRKSRQVRKTKRNRNKRIKHRNSCSFTK